jgi:hypothetical protein
MRTISGESKYIDYEMEYYGNNYKVSFHVFNLLKWLRSHCICPETSRDIIS